MRDLLLDDHFRGVWALRVEREKAEEARLSLWRMGAVDRTRRIVEREGDILIPLSRVDIPDPQGEIVEVPSIPVRKGQETPFQTIMRDLEIPAPAKERLPRRWELVGDVLVLKLDPSLRAYEKMIAEAYAHVLGAKTVLEDVGGIGGELREPKLRLIVGTETTTIHKENGVKFKLDVEKVMFSSGNVHERLRMARVCEPGETVVDMFAGIGYFSLPIAVHGSPAKVTCCEKSPLAYSFLKTNAHLNRVEDVLRPLLGDCLDVAPEGVADRVIMGYLKDTSAYLPKAISVLNGEGIVHCHEACPNELLPERPKRAIERAAKKSGKTATVTKARMIKSYSPGVSHVVLDVEIR